MECFLTPDVYQTGGREGGLRSTSQATDIQRKVANLLRCFGEFERSSGGESHAARWAGEHLPPHIAKNNNHLLSFNEKSYEPGSVFPVD